MCMHTCAHLYMHVYVYFAVIHVWQETRITFLRRMANTVTPSQITEGLMRWPLEMLAAISLDQEDLWYAKPFIHKPLMPFPCFRCLKSLLTCCSLWVFSVMQQGRTHHLCCLSSFPTSWLLSLLLETGNTEYEVPVHRALSPRNVL